MLIFHIVAIYFNFQSAILVLIALILELAGGIYIVVHGTENSKLTPWLNDKFNSLIIDSNYNDRALSLLQTVQEKVTQLYTFTLIKILILPSG